MRRENDGLCPSQVTDQIADFNDLIEFLDSGSPLAVPAKPYQAAMQAYRSRYGV